MLFLERKRKRYLKLKEAAHNDDENINFGIFNMAFSGSFDDLGLAPVHYAAKHGDKLGLKELTKSPGGFSFLRLKSKCGSIAAHFAAQHGHTELLSWILKYDKQSLDVEDEKGMTPFLAAVQHGQYDTLKYMIKHTNVDLWATNFRGQNGAHIASQHNFLNCLRLVVTSGCPVLVHDYIGFTPLHVATKYNNTNIVRWLMTYTPISGREKDDMGCTPLHIACEFGHDSLIRAFIRSGIPLTSEDIECRTPEMVADMYQQTSSLRVIDEERRRLQLIEDAAPYIGTLTRRDKRKRPDIRQTEFRAQESVGAYSPASQTTSLRRANTVCSSDVNSYLRNKCNRESLLSQGSEMSLKRHSKSTFDSGFESGLGDILDEILGATVYDPVFEDNETPKTKWQNFKEKISAAFIASAKRNDTMDNLSDESGIKITKWDKLQKFVKVKLAKISQQDLDMGGFEDEHWRSLEPRQFHRGTRRTQSMVRWKGRGR